jgi:NO-binding membrane sensor protein with MHYT domain
MVVFSYNAWLVGLSVVLSLMSAFTGLSLTRGLRSVSLGARQVRIVMAAIALGGGIWSMHFVAMLAMRFGVPVFYEVIETVASALIAILLAGLALLILHFGPRTRAAILAAGTILGMGIVGMHYVGLSAIEGCRPVLQPLGVVIAGLLAVAMGVAAIQIAYGKRTERNILLATVVFGASVAVVHFAAMATTSFVPAPAAEAALTVPVLANAQVAVIVLLSAFVISGAFLVSGASFLNRDTGLLPPVAAGDHGAVRMDTPTPAAGPAPAALLADRRPEGLRLPYEKDGKTYLIGFDKVAAIQSEGHYTTAWLAQSPVFCPWSISQAEAAVPEGFLRVHRQWLVNMALVQGFERTKDNGFCLMSPGGALDRVPVSRTRVGTVRDALGL